MLHRLEPAGGEDGRAGGDPPPIRADRPVGAEGPVHRYLVVLHQGEWKIFYRGHHFGPYSTAQAARSYAVAAAHEAAAAGGSAEVRMQEADGRFTEEWVEPAPRGPSRDRAGP